MKDNFTYNNPPQMADYGLNENDFHHCGDDVNDEQLNDTDNDTN